MLKNKLNLFLGVLIISSVLAVTVYLFSQSQRDVSQIKKEITRELRQEIKAIVKDELDTLFAGSQDYRQKQANLPNKDKLRVSDNRVNTKEGIRELVKTELESYFAGELEQAAPAAPGLIKRKAVESKAGQPNFLSWLFAKNKPKKAEVLNETPEVLETIASGETPKRDEAVERTLVQKGGMLLPRGTLQVEPSFTTAHFSSNRINIQGFSILPVLVIGEISTESVKRDIFIESLSLKYGLLNNLQGELRVPYRYELDRVTSNLGAESTRDSSGMGDVEFAISRQIGFEQGIRPDLVANLSVKSITGEGPYNRDIGLGTGHYAIRGNLIASKSSDPAVIFGSLNYTWNIKRNIANYGAVDPGDTIGYSLGTAIGLSYQAAMNFQFEHSFTSKMKKDGIPVNGSFLNAASLKAGFTWSVSEKSSIDFSVGFGLTTDSPDYVVEIRFPFTF